MTVEVKNENDTKVSERSRNGLQKTRSNREEREKRNICGWMPSKEPGIFVLQLDESELSYDAPELMM